MAAIVQELFRFGVYKRNQGRIARQATFAAMGVIVALAAWSLSDYLAGFASQQRDWSTTQHNLMQFGIPLVLLALGLWASFRIVQMPAFADFLISVEGEMNKVSWPSRGELFRAALVVILVIFFLATLLFLYDLLLGWLMNAIDRMVTHLFG